MTLRSRLAFAMVFLVVGTICALAVFGDGFGRATLVVGAIAILLALVLAAANDPGGRRAVARQAGCDAVRR